MTTAPPRYVDEVAAELRAMVDTLTEARASLGKSRAHDAAGRILDTLRDAALAIDGLAAALNRATAIDVHADAVGLGRVAGVLVAAIPPDHDDTAVRVPLTVHDVAAVVSASLLLTKLAEVRAALLGPHVPMPERVQ